MQLSWVYTGNRLEMLQARLKFDQQAAGTLLRVVKVSDKLVRSEALYCWIMFKKGLWECMRTVLSGPGDGDGKTE